jgi:hypothetical protein
MQRICLVCGGFLAVHKTVYDRKSSHIGFDSSISNLNCACQISFESKLHDQLLKTCVRTVLTKPVTIHELATEIAFNLGCETPVLRRGGSSGG